MKAKGKTLEQIDLLFSGPKVLLDLSEAERRRLQEEEIHAAIAERRVELSEGKEVPEVEHVEV